jgi:hypothetical protein
MNKFIQQEQLERQQLDQRPFGGMIKERFFGEKRNLQLAVKRLHDALLWDGSTMATTEEKDFIGCVQLVEMLQELCEANFRATVREAVAFLQSAEDEFYARHAHGSTGHVAREQTVLFRGEYLLLAAVQEVLARKASANA